MSVIILLYVLHLDILENGGGFVLKKLLISHASLKLFWESLNSMVICLIIICLVFKICETFFWVCWILRKDWSMIIVLRYGGDNIKSHASWLVVNLKNTCVKVCDSRSMHVWWTVMWWSRSMIYLLIVFLMSGGRGRAMVFSYQSIPLGACA